MKKLILSLFIVALLAGVACAGSPIQAVIARKNAASGCAGHNCGLDTDGDLFGRWLMEATRDNGSYTQLDDSGPNSEHLTSGAQPANDATSKEGTYSAEFSADDYVYLADASLNAGFPFSNGSGVTTITVCAWVLYDADPAESSWHAYFSKWHSANNNRDFFAGVYNDAGTVKWRGYVSEDGTDTVFVTGNADQNPSTGTWYFACIGADPTNVYIKIRASNGSTVGTDLAGAHGVSSLNLDAAAIQISGISSSATIHWEGHIDEVLVFDRVVSASDVTDLAEGDYGQ